MSPRPDPERAWKAWRTAEAAALERPAKLEQAAAKLPERQAWILRTMAALDRGDRTELGELALALLDAGQHDLVCILRLALLEPREIDPTHVRRQAKNLGVANGPGLPVLDLIRLFAVAMGNRKGTRPPSLARAADDRSVLDAVLPLLSSKFTDYAVGEWLLPLSPRLAGYWAAAMCSKRPGLDVRRGIRAVIPGAHADFPEDEWPDLGKPSGAGSIERWLATSPPPIWDEELNLELTAIRTTASRDERRRLLGSLLARIDEIVRQEHPGDAVDPTYAALELTDSLEGLAHHRPLMDQLLHLAMRLGWFRGDGERPVELLGDLWFDLQGAPAEERLAVAREMIHNGDHTDEDVEQLYAEMALELIRGTRDLEGEALPVLRKCGGDLPRKKLERALAGWKDRAGAEYLLGVHELERGELAAALHRGARMFTETDRSDLAVRLALDALREGIDMERRVPRRLRRAFEVLLDSLVDREIPIELAARLPGRIQHICGREELGSRLSRLEGSLRGALESASTLEHRAPAEQLILLTALGEDERARRRLRELARSLRLGVQQPATWSLALKLAGRLTECPRPRPALVQKALDGVSSFLFHRGPWFLLEPLRARLSADPRARTLLSTWIAGCEEVDLDDPGWLEVFGLLLPKELADDVGDVFAEEMMRLEEILEEDFHG